MVRFERTTELAVAMLVAMTAPAVADTCDLKFDGQVILAGLECDVEASEGEVFIEQGNYVTIKITKGGELWTNVGNPPSKSPDDPNRYKLKSFGKVTKKEADDGVCYTNKRVELCLTK